MKNFYTPEVLKNFIGRKRELAEIEKIKKSKQAECLIIYGRRRVGKTEFIEQGFLGSKILKFEGIQPPKNLNKKEALKYQIDKQLINLANYLQDQKIARLQIDSWYDFFLLLTEYIKEKNLVVYFEEVQWLANYEDYFFAELKPIWDNHWRHNSKLKLVFCGSSPSFLISQLMSDKAFYNRATKEIHLQEFSLAKTGEFMGKRFSDFEKVLAHITVGGIPEYLKKLKDDSSVFQSLLNNSFLPDAFFVQEKEKIFISSLKTNSNFEEILNYLSYHKVASREQIANHLQVKSGGSLSNLLEELELCGFISSNTPLQLAANSKLNKYSIHKVLIAPYGASEGLEKRAYFDEVINLSGFKTRQTHYKIM